MLSEAFPLWFKRETNLKLRWQSILSTSPTLYKYFSASTPSRCVLQRNCVISGRARTSDQNGSHLEKDTQDSEARPERYARQKEGEQSAGLPFCTGTNASHIAERELKDTGSRQGEGRRRGSAAGTASGICLRVTYRALGLKP